MNSNKIILVGGGGHCVSIIEMIRSTDQYSIFGILDVQEKVGQEINGVKIIGTDNEIASYCKDGFSFIISIGQLKSSELRRRLSNEIEENGGNFATIIATSAYVSKTAKIGSGTVIGHKAFVNAGVNIGTNTIINSGAIIEHDVTIGDFCHISTNSTINGDCTIGNDVFVGSGCIVNLGINITNQTILGSGSVVIKDINESGFYTGIPAIKHG